MSEKIIYKWGPLSFDTYNIRGRVIHTALQNDEVYVWSELSTEPNVKYLYRAVKLHPTGVPYSGEYLGTVVTPSGLVWHVIEVADNV